jgi:hypothetical protein
MAIGICHADDVAPSNPQKLVLPSPTSGSRSVSMVRSWTQAMELVIYAYIFFCSSDDTILNVDLPSEFAREKSTFLCLPDSSPL